MDDDCDFEALCDMLDEDDDDQVTSNSKAENKSDICSSSDDDIDEDELDKLAALMEEDVVEEASTPQAPAPDKVNKPHPAQRDKQDSDSVSEKAKEKDVQVHKEVSKAATAEVKKEPEETGTTDKPSSDGEIDYTLKLKELQAMQEKIKRLEAELMQKASSQKSPPSNPPEKAAAASSTSIKNEVKSDKKPVDNKPSLRPLEDDIFGAVESSSSPAPRPRVPSASPKLKPAVKKQKEATPSDLQPSSMRQNDDSDSDWEEMDGERPSNLSHEGKEMKKLLTKGTRERVAHTPKRGSTTETSDVKYEPTTQKKYTVAKYEPNIPKKDPSVIEKAPNPYNQTWKNKPSGSQSSPAATSSAQNGSSNAASSKHGNDSDCMNERYSGIRIINPLVSSSQLSSLMEGRRNMRISRLDTKVGSMDLKSDWVTIGVMVSKTEAKKSQKGNQYSIWRLSDLDDCDKTINFFLFNKVYQEHWKTVQGSVIGLLNPTVMQKEENKLSSEVSITIDNPRKMLLMGRSKDLGKCRAKTKAGNDCNNFVNLTKGEYCTYHVQSAYKKHSAKRSELQAGFSGVVPKSFEKKIFNKGGTVTYGGQSFATTGHSGAPKRGRAVSIQSLQHHHLKKAQSSGVAKASTLELHDLLPEDRRLLDQLKTDKQAKAGKPGTTSTQEKFYEALSMPTVGSMNLVKHMKNQEKVKEKEKQAALPQQSVSVKDFLKAHERTLKAKVESHNRQAGSRTRASGGPSKPAVTPKDRVPSLGKGLSAGDDLMFDLDDCDASVPKISFKAERKKQKALAVLQAKGGVEKKDPNSTKKAKSPKHQERVKKRLAETSPDAPGEENAAAPPPKKRSRALGGVDLDDPKIQKLLTARSSHEGALTEREQQQMDEYFDPLEKKEAMEEKMSGIMEVKVKAFTCTKCKYTYYAPRRECREQGHKIVNHEALKRFFKCKECNQRTVTLEKYPALACKKCGSQKFEKTSMLKEKKGPKLASEELLLRGEEIKNLNSLQS